MHTELTDVWYACYGSNICEDRFLCYINGGTPAGAKKHFKGCEDRTKPKDSRAFTIPHEVYFAKESATWDGGGICFLNPEKSNKQSLGRVYQIGVSQFKDLVRQELIFEGAIEIDFEALRKNGSYNCLPNGRYGELLYLGELEGKPVISFTSPLYLSEEINAPSAAYLKTIAKGLQEIYDIDKEGLIEYFSELEGIKNTSAAPKLSKILS